jgi:hypothetical protein
MVRGEFVNFPDGLGALSAENPGIGNPSYKKIRQGGKGGKDREGFLTLAVACPCVPLAGHCARAVSARPGQVLHPPWWAFPTWKVQQMAGAGTIRGAEPWHHNLAPAGKLAVEMTFWLALPSVHLPGQHPRVGPQIIQVPMPARGAVKVPMHTRHQPAFGAAGIRVIPPWKVLALQTANSDLQRCRQPQKEGIGPP